MSNGIKVGDKVRVREDAPRKTRLGEVIPTKRDFTVTGIGKNYAEIKLIGSLLPTYYPIPLKYLVKVDAEAKEAKFKVGDKMFYVCSPTIKHKCTVTKVTQNEHSGKNEYNVMFEWGKPGMYLPESDLGPYTEPTEQTEAEKNDADNLKKVAEEWANTVSNAIREYGDAMCQRYIDAHTEAYWDAYAAELAKEAALKVANKYNNPKEAAEYAVSVAKAVVENLKKK